MKAFPLALRQLKREWRAGELSVLALALVVAVASVTSVNFFTSRVHQTLENEASDLLGGDLVFLADDPVTEQRKQEAAALGLRLAETVEFPTMVLSETASQLVALKAVSTGYPLKGSHRTAPRLFAPDTRTEGGPEPGTVWAGSRLLTILGLDVGDSVTVGATRLKVSAILTNEPDQSEGVMMNIAPRLLMHTDDLPATELVQPASRIQFRLLMAGPPEKIAQLRQRWEPELKPGQGLHNVTDARPEVRSALARAESFLSLAAMVSVLLAGVAVAMAARRFVNRHLDDCAVMRCLGAEQSLISSIYTLQMLLLGLSASLVGILFGYLAQWGLIGLLQPIAGIALPPPSPWPALEGLLTGVITLLGFAVPPILQLKNIPTLQVLRRDLGRIPTNSLLAYGAAIGAFFLLVALQAKSLKMTLAIVVGLLLILGLLGLLAGLLLLVLRPLRRRGGSAWRFGLTNISRRSGHSLIQMVGFSVGLMALLLLAVVRSDLLAAWENRLPADTPNRFLINIQPDQLTPLREFFHSEQVEAPLLYPMIRARLTRINETPVNPENFKTDRAKRLIKREFNLSWADTVQEGNEIVAGTWWSPDDAGRPLFSVEQSLAEELGLELGDTLTYEVAGESFTARISNLRTVDWESFRANFFVIAPPGFLDGLPVNYISGFYLPQSQHEILGRLVQKFPSVTVLDVATILNQIRDIIERVTLAVEYIFLFTLCAGLLVMHAAIHATLDDRLREAAVMRTLGARQGQLLGSILMEYAGLGLLSGLVAAIVAGAVGMAVAEQVFDLNYIPGPGLWLGGTLAAALGVGLMGTMGSRFVLKQPPLQTLRRL